MIIAYVSHCFNMTSSIDVKPMDVSGRTISLYCSGFSSPSQLCSPSPVRSGKTPISPDPISETCSSVSPEFSDEENRQFFMGDVHHISRRRQSKRRPRLSVPSTNCSASTITTTELLSDPLTYGNTAHSSRLGKHSNSLDMEFILYNECDLSTGRLPRFIRIEQDKEDEEFLSRMHARPVSIAVDSISQLDLYTVKLTDDYSTSTLRPSSPLHTDEDEFNQRKQSTSSNDSETLKSININHSNSPDLSTTVNEIIFIKSNRMSSSEVS